jgi:hypothetical protein
MGLPLGMWHDTKMTPCTLRELSGHWQHCYFDETADLHFAAQPSSVTWPFPASKTGEPAQWVARPLHRKNGFRLPTSR